MKIVLGADFHVEHSSGASNLRGQLHCNILLKKVRAVIEAERADAFVIHGDFFDQFGVIESSQASQVKDWVLALSDELSVKVIFITGNHEYADVRPEYFGKSILTALFGELEHRGIYVIDAEPRMIRLDAKHLYFGIPYRETLDQFESSCLKAINEAAAYVDSVVTDETVLVGWHVGLPFGKGHFKGDEKENGWIRPDHEYVKKIFSISTTKVVYCGHYHGPNETDAAGLGKFKYIGSPATRSREESEQDKRLISWQGGKEKIISTGLVLDKIVKTADEAIDYQKKLVKDFGEEAKNISTIHIKLGEAASMDDYAVEREKLRGVAGVFKVEKPASDKTGMKTKRIIEADESGAFSDFEESVAFIALIDYFFHKESDATKRKIKQLDKIRLDEGLLALSEFKDALAAKQNALATPLDSQANDDKEVVYNDQVAACLGISLTTKMDWQGLERLCEFLYCEAERRDLFSLCTIDQTESLETLEGGP